MHKIYDENDKAHGDSVAELIHGLWYRYCEKCNVYHALASNVESADNFSVSPVTRNVRGRRSGSGRGRLMLVKPTINVSDNAS